MSTLDLIVLAMILAYAAFQWDRQMNRAIRERAEILARLERIEDALEAIKSRS